MSRLRRRLALEFQLLNLDLYSRGRRMPGRIHGDVVARKERRSQNRQKEKGSDPCLPGLLPYSPCRRLRNPTERAVEANRLQRGMVRWKRVAAGLFITCSKCLHVIYQVELFRLCEHHPHTHPLYPISRQHHSLVRLARWG